MGAAIMENAYYHYTDDGQYIEFSAAEAELVMLRTIAQCGKRPAYAFYTTLGFMVGGGVAALIGGSINQLGLLGFSVLLMLGGGAGLWLGCLFEQQKMRVFDQRHAENLRLVVAGRTPQN
jgi:hypothetical protein